MEGLPIILFVIFLLMSVVEKVLKKPGPGDGPPPGRRPPPRQQPRPPEVRRPGERRPVQPMPRPMPPLSSGGQTTGRADEMIPEDFWRELTGQARPRPTPPAAPVPRSPADLPSWDEGAIAEIEAADDEEAEVTAVRSLEEYRREIVLHEPPRIVSLETMPLPPERRHAAYHARLEQAAALEVDVTPESGLAMSLRARLQNPAGIRDALILTEVLGRPKGLE